MYVMTDAENGTLNPLGVNCLRQFQNYGDVVWGARTLQGNDQAGSQWKYVPIRRLALLHRVQSLRRHAVGGLRAQRRTAVGPVRLNVGTFMQGLFLQGAFQGSTPQQAYFVKCDAENNPQASIDLGIVNVLVGFAPLYPAEFVVIQIQQIGRSSCKRKEITDGNISRQSHASGPVQELQVPLEVGRTYVAGVSKVSGLKRTTEVVEHRRAAIPSTAHKSPGRNKYEAITLERGLTQDLEFHDWAAWSGTSAPASARKSRWPISARTSTWSSTTRPARLVIAYKIYRCWVSEYQAMPDLDANANAIAIEHIKLENEGWERDTSVTEQAEPALSTTSVAT